MSKSRSTSPVTKIVIDYDTFERYKKLENEIKELHRQKKEDLKIKSPKQDTEVDQITEENQLGEGQQSEQNSNKSSHICEQDSFIDTIVSKVVKKLEKNSNTNNLINHSQLNTQVGEGVDVLPPVASFVDHNVSQPIESDAIKIKSSQHDNFDDQKLLDLIPLRFKTRASTLLINIKNNPLQIDYNKKGEIFIDTQNIPDSNIFDIFPELFVRKKKKRLLGLQELATKIATLGWGSLICKGIAKGLKRPKNYKMHENTQHSLKDFKNWWYMSM